MKFHFFTIKKITGTFYDCEAESNTLVVYAMGAPNVPDNGGLALAPFVMKEKLDLFVPDYIGFGRTPGVFTPKNCIKTLLLCYDYFSKGCVGINKYESKRKFFKYKKIIFVGKSLGAVYVPLLPKFNKIIDTLAVFCGAMDQSEQGKIKGEETNRSFIDGLYSDFHFLYRGMNPKAWWKHIEDLDGLSPMDNIKYLKNAKVFIAHGEKDTCVHYSKSVKYYEKLIKTFPENKKNFKLKIYKKGDHGISTTNKAIVDFLKWV